MKLIDRFTRDDVSAKVWWPFALVGVVALVLTVPGANRAADEARADAAARADQVSHATIQGWMQDGSDVQTVSSRLSALVADDPVWTAARVWSPEFKLWATSEENEVVEIDSGEANNDADLSAALDNGTHQVVTDRLPTGGPGPTTFHAYTRINTVTGSYVTEFEARDAVLLADVHREWLGYRIVAGLATLLLLGLAFLSMREPLAPIGTNVRFYPESLPANRAVVDVDRAVELDQADERIQDRISGLQERLDESERLRKKAEAQLQQALTTLGSSGRSIAVPRPGPEPTREAQPPTPTPRRGAPPAPAAQPAPARTSAPAPKPVATPQPVAAPQPVTAPQPVARRKKPEQPAQPVMKPAAQAPPVTKAPPPPVTAPAPAAKAPPVPPKRREPGKHASAPPEPVTVASDDVSVTAKPPGSNDRVDRPGVVVVPEAEKTPAAARAHGPDTDDDVLDVLNRLVPSPEEPHPLDDPGDLRARLARTAALKKPGSRERQEEREAASEGPAQQ